MNLLQRALGRGERSITTLEDYAAALAQALGGYGPPGVQQSLTGSPAERIPVDLVSYATAGFAGNGVVFSCMTVRQLVFSAVRFTFQQLTSGRPSRLFGTAALTLLERPWPGGTTQDLLSRMIQDADLAGNSYWTTHEGQMVRLRPDWVEIVLRARIVHGAVCGYERVGYLYREGGHEDPVYLYRDEVVHFAPIPDPLATYRGMSWLTPVIRELRADGQMNDHKSRFLANAATPNLVVKFDAKVTPEHLEKFKARMDARHSGTHNAGNTMYLGGGADVSVVGVDWRSMDLKAIQGGLETRIAAAAGVPPVVVGLSEGLQGSSLNAGNYASSRRRFADGTMHPLWSNVAGSMEVLVPPPAAARLWYDARDVPFLREDAKDSAEIQQIRAITIRQLVDAGYTPESVVAAVEAEDMTLLQHSGLYSVQLQPPGTVQAVNSGSGTEGSA